MVTSLACDSSDPAFYSYVDAGVTTICLDVDGLVTYLPAGGEYVPDKSGKEPSGYKLIVYTKIYGSNDGGLTWQLWNRVQSDGQPKPYNQQANCSGPATHLPDNANAPVQFRWQPAGLIETSGDGGLNWFPAYDLYELRQDIRKEYKPHSLFDGIVDYDTRPGPRSGLIDPVTDNVVLAMGWDGVFVRTKGGNWLWAPVGQYHLDDLTNFNSVRDVLFFEWWEAGALIILVLTTSATYIRRRRFIVLWVFPIIGWAGWILIAGFLLPEYHHTQDLFTLGIVALILLNLACLVLIAVLWDLVKNFRSKLQPILGIGLLMAVSYLFPLVLWTQGIIPYYSTAMGFALFLTAASIIAGVKYLHPILPTVEPKTAHPKKVDTETSSPQ